MQNLKDIDMALVCMILLYTMPIENVADAVLTFKFKTVLPYHYRETDGLSNVENFKKMINSKNKTIKVVQLNWCK